MPLLESLLHFSLGFSFARVWSAMGGGGKLTFVLHLWFGLLVSLGANALLSLVQIYLSKNNAFTGSTGALMTMAGAVVEAVVFGLLLAPPSTSKSSSSSSTSHDTPVGNGTATLATTTTTTTTSTVSPSTTTSTPVTAVAPLNAVNPSSSTTATTSVSTTSTALTVVNKEKALIPITTVTTSSSVPVTPKPKVKKLTDMSDTESNTSTSKRKLKKADDADAASTTSTSSKTKKSKKSLTASDSDVSSVPSSNTKVLKKAASAKSMHSENSETASSKKLRSATLPKPVGEHHKESKKELTHHRVAKKNTSEFPSATDDDFAKLIHLAKSPEKWTEVHRNSHVVVYEQATPGSQISIIKLVTSFHDIDAVVLYDALHDPDYRKVWDERMVEGFEIEKLDDFNDVGYYQAHAPPPMANRDWVNQRSWRVKDEKEYIIMNHSVVHPKAPERKGVVRAWSLLTGYLVETLPEGGCSLIYCTQNDAKGWIPTWIKNLATRTFAPSIVEKMHKAAAEYESWKGQQQPPLDGRPWRIHN